MARCPHCSHEIKPTEWSGFCVHCGAVLPLEEPADPVGEDDQTVELPIGPTSSANQTEKEPTPSEQEPEAPEIDQEATIDFTGEATVELPPKESVQSDLDPEATVDFGVEKTIEFSASDNPADETATTSFAPDATVDFDQPDDPISLSWNQAAKTARIDQTIQIGGTVSGFRSSLPIKSRALHSKLDSQIGSVVLGTAGDAPDYELLDLLGQGGMGVVYTAKQSSIARTVAVKMLKPTDQQGSGSQGSEDQRDKFISEAVITGELEHPNIVPIYDLGANNEGALFYSMKRVKGTPWDEVIGQKSLNENLGILMRVADAVAFAHASGVIHRDLKPENVMLGDYGEVLVMDWGLARVTAAFPSAESVYQAESLGGTPAYMAPEMATGPIDKIDHRSDVYLLGAILFEIVGGKPPHTGKDAMDCLKSASRNVIRPIDYQGELLATALQAMQTKPTDRFQSVKEFQQSVQNYLSHAESVALTASATRNLEQASESGDYETFSKALFGFEEAIELWPENTNALSGVGEARLAYARTAERKGDLDLGLSLLESPISDREEERAELVAQLRSAQSEREARKRRLRNAKRLAMALLLTIICGGAYSYYEINKQKNEAFRQKGIAETQRGVAEEQRQQAESNAELAQKNEKKANRNAELAEKNAEQARKNARIAKQNEQEAIEARDLAKVAQSKAEKAEARAVQAKESEEYEAYVARIGLAAEKIEENAFREALALLDACPAEMRHWEWGRLRYLCDLSQRVFDLGAPVDAVCYSPEGDRFATGDWNGNLILRNTNSGDKIWNVKIGRYVHAVAFSPDGSIVAAGTDQGSVLLVNARNGRTIKKLLGHEQGVLSLSFSPTDNLLASAGYDQTVRVWDLGSENPPEVLLGHSWWVWSLSFAPDGSKLVSTGQDGKAIVWTLGDNRSFKKLTEFTGHVGPVYGAAFSPDSQQIATCGYDQTISLWDAEIGLTVDIQARLAGEPEKERNDQRLVGHTGPVRSLAYSSDGNRIVSGSQDNTLRVWDLADGTATTLRGHGGRVRSVAFNPSQGQALSGAHDNQVRLWDLGEYREQRVLRAEKLRGHRDAVLSARFSSDAQQVVTASRDRTARLWEVSSSRPIHTFSEGHAFLASSALLFDNGKRLATAAGDNTTRVWDVATGIERFELEQTGRSAALAVSPNGNWLVTGGPNGAVRWWNTNTGQMLSEANSHEADVTAIAVGPNGKLVASGDDRGRIYLWRFDSEQNLSEPTLLRGHSRTITGLCFRPDGLRLVSSSGDRSVGQWDITSGKELDSKVLKHPEWVSALALSQDGTRLLTASDDGYARVWNVEEARLIAKQQLDGLVFNDVDLSANGNQALLTASAKRAVYRWDIEADSLEELKPIGSQGGLVWSARYGLSDRTLVTVGGNDSQLWLMDPLRPAMRFSPHGAVADAVISPDGKMIATGSWDATAKLWDAQTGKPLRKLSGGHRGYVNSIEFSPRGTELLTAGDDGKVRFWKANTGELQDQSLAGHRGRILQACYAKSGQLVLTASSDKTAKIWERASGKVLVTLSGHEWAVTSVAISPDQQLVVTGSDDNTAMVWDLKLGSKLHTLSGHTAGVASVAISPDGLRILTGGLDGAVKLWDSVSGKELLTLSGHSGEVTRVEFSPDGSQALTASRDGTAIIWSTANWEQAAELPLAVR